MHWGVFAISAAHLYLPKLPWRASSPNPRETSERMNFNDIDKKHLIWKLFTYWYLMSFFQKKMSQNVWATIMPFGPVTLIFYWPKKKFPGRPKALSLRLKCASASSNFFLLWPNLPSSGRRIIEIISSVEILAGVPNKDSHIGHYYIILCKEKSESQEQTYNRVTSISVSSKL